MGEGGDGGGAGGWHGRVEGVEMGGRLVHTGLPCGGMRAGEGEVGINRGGKGGK